MKRKAFINSTTLTLGSLFLSNKIDLKKSINQSPYNLVELRNDIYIYKEIGGTIGTYINKDGVVVVDTQMTKSIQHFIEAVNQKTQFPFKFVINTHHHGDHTGGNIAFKGKVENIVGHENCLKNYQIQASKNNNVDLQLFQNVIFKDNWTTKLGQQNIKAYYFGAAHTNGDIVIHFEDANIAHVGDLVFNKIYPYIDAGAGGNLKGWITVLNKIITTFNKDTIFIFGHGTNGEVIGKMDDIQKMKNYIEQLFVFVESEIKLGKSKEQILENTIIPNVGDWKDDYKRVKSNIEVAYNEILMK